MFMVISMWKSDLSDEIKWKLFQSVAVSVVLYGYTTENLTKRQEKKKRLDGKYTVLGPALNKWWKQHSKNSDYTKTHS